MIHCLCAACTKYRAHYYILPSPAFRSFGADLGLKSPSHTSILWEMAESRWLEMVASGSGMGHARYGRNAILVHLTWEATQGRGAPVTQASYAREECRTSNGRCRRYRAAERTVLRLGQRRGLCKVQDPHGHADPILVQEPIHWGGKMT